MRLRRRTQAGFTLTELAVVFAIVVLLIGGAMMTLSAQTEQRNFTQTRERLQEALDALIGFAVVNGRLPCPAIGGAAGVEAPLGGGTCTTYFNGFLPGRTLGIMTTDTEGYVLDAWGNRIRYAVSNAVTGCTATPTGPPYFTSRDNLKANGVSCKPNDLDICRNAACTARAVSTETVALVVFSTGKNGGTPGVHGPDEQANLDNNPVFVSRTPSAADSPGGAYDDVMVWLPAGVLYLRLISAGVLP